MKLKAITAIVLASILVASCGNKAATPVVGQVVSCTSLRLNNIDFDTPGSLCLDGEIGPHIEAVAGPLIINVWGSWCEPCKEEIPFFVELYKDLDPSIQLIGIDVEEHNLEVGQAFVRAHGITWPNFYDQSGATRARFGMGVPVTWFIGADGKVLYKKIGVMSSVDELRQLSQKYLGAS